MNEKVLELILSKLDNIDNRLSKIESELSEVKEELSEVKEDTEITRSAVNSLCERAEAASGVIGVRFPVE